MARRRAACRTRAESVRRRLHPHRRVLHFEPLEYRRMLANVVVGNNLDLVNGDTSSIANLIAGDGGDGISLREAILAANFTAGADEVTFDAALSGQTITLGGTELTISEALVIDARALAANVAVDANQLSRIFNITATTGDFTLGGLTLTGGRTTASFSAGRGGAISSLTTGNLVLDESTVSGNSTMGYSARGGGILAIGNVTLTRSTVSGNSTTGDFAIGGGISAVMVTVTESTISGNSTAGQGAYGGGVFAFTSVTLTQSTVSGNSTAGPNAHGGGIRLQAQGALTLNQTTVTDNHAMAASSMGGGVFQADTALNRELSISGSILAGNTASGGGADLIKDPDSTLTVNYSLIGTGITPSAGGNNVVTNNPQLGPLADNGGPTQTRALLAGSPAIDAGDPSIVFDPAQFDQRGAPFVRVVDGEGIGGVLIDIGAYEAQSLVLVDTTADENDGDYSTGDLSLREAIALANADPNVDTITFAPTLSGETIVLGGTELVLTEALVIDATSLAANVTIDANEASRIFNIRATTGDFTLGGLTLTGGRTTGDGATFNDTTFSGGAIRSLTSGSLTIEKSTVRDNTTTGNNSPSGGIYAVGALRLTESTVSGNSTTGINALGGGILATNVTLTQSTVSGNSTAGSNARGGGVFAAGAVMLTQSTVSGNSTAGGNARGGGIYAHGAVMLTQSTASGNSTAGSNARGGGIYAVGSVKLTQSTVSDNNTLGFAAASGGIYAVGTVTVTKSTVSGNRTAAGGAFGGGISAVGSVTLTQSTISGNSTAGQSATGGGVFAAGAVMLTQSTLSGNSTAGDLANGGGIFAQSSVTLTLSTVSGNGTAGNSANGGGIWAYGQVTFTQSTVTDNRAMHATSMGGGVFQPGSLANDPLSISGSIVAGNTAGGGGDDLVKDPDSMLTVNYSLIGVGITPTSGGNNLLADDPQLGPLADNGGPTQTHALLPGGPAIDAGDPIAGSSMPVVWYRFEETAGTTTADAVSTHDGTLQNGAALGESGPPKLVGNAVAFDGVDDYISVANGFDNTELDGESYTVELWFNAAAGGKQQTLVALTDGQPSPGHVVLVEINAANTIRFLNRIPAGISGGNDLSSIGTISPGSWHHLAAVRKFEFMWIYLDGVQIVMLSSASGDLPDGMVMTVGRLAESLSARYFDGRMDDVAIYNHALSADEIALHSAAGIPTTDQRGVGFDRVVGGRIDMGAFEVQPIATSADFDGDGDVDGRDFLLWQRGESPNPLGSGDLELWQGQYGSGQLSVVSSQLLDGQGLRAESREPDSSMTPWAVTTSLGSRLRGSDTLIAGTRTTRSGLQRDREDASDVVPVFEDSYVEEVDRALEQLANVPSGVRSFGEMVARRGKMRITPALAGATNAAR